MGGSPQSVVRAAHYGFPLMLAIIGGPVARFAPFADLHRRALAEFGHEPQPIGYHTYGHVADTDDQAQADFYEPYTEQVTRIGRERGWAPPSREAFENELVSGSMAVGSPETVARKIADGVRALGAERFHLKVSTGPLAHDRIMRSIELFGTEVVPLVRELLG